MLRLSSRIALSLLSVLVVASTAHAGVSIGDTAPPLSIKTWVRGDPVDLGKEASKRVHVVEFWATWCPPCKASIPLLTDYQKNYGKELSIVGITDPDTDRNTPSMIKEFVKDQGPRMGYTVAMDDRGATTNAYMGDDMVGIRGHAPACQFNPESKAVGRGERLAGQDLVGVARLDRSPGTEEHVAERGRPARRD